ncbi:MAG TPA: phosphate-binding protein [Anaerolineaceae bacterium]|uniref:Phosphate-binding protein n=1 Tax=Anaerolinea thermophila TaxID=167964 RepID=A0A124FMX4_9CHLR|nr:MAG: Putative phosphate ABC transporter substrate binding protein [Anaerolinea thermophila]HAF61680.1 phosphate-binding protein [Anaerolineaceae bacterium]
MKKSIAIFFILIFFMAGCGSDNSPTTSNSNGTTQNKYIEDKGSDTLVNLALIWAEKYQLAHPDIQISVSGGGSGTGITSLTNGTVDIANASRAIKDEEISEANNQGIDPNEIVVAYDAIAVIVNPENPVDRLTVEQVSQIYQGLITNWKELGGEDRPIVCLSRETNSGTHVYFLENVVRMGDSDSKVLFSQETLLLPSSEGIISEVRDNPNAIGYDGLGYVTDEVKVLALSQGEEYVLPSEATVKDKSYPIARQLYMYTNGEPTGAIKDYIDWILSPEAQQYVLDLGFIPYRSIE